MDEVGCVMNAPANQSTAIKRRPTTRVQVGNINIGSAYPVVVQSMTNTDTADAQATAAQVAALASAGSELVRVTINNDQAAAAIPRICHILTEQGVHIPLVGDFHYNGHLLLRDHPQCARALAKYRINPGNVGGKRKDANFRAIVEQAIRFDKPVRIGVNWGSLDQQLLTELMTANANSAQPRPDSDVLLDAIVESCLRSAHFAEQCGLGHDHIILGAKVSNVPDLVKIYRQLADHCDYPLHLGLTEAGMGAKGIVWSTAGLAILLAEGIGDTVRVSITPTPGCERTDEVIIAQQILQALSLRQFYPLVTSCPGCGRTSSTAFQQLAAKIERYIQDKMPAWRQCYPGVENLRLAVMGCIVNGPGESRHADIGISLPGHSEDPAALVYMDGQLTATLRGDNISDDFIRLLASYVHRRFTQDSPKGC